MSDAFYTVIVHKKEGRWDAETAFGARSEFFSERTIMSAEVLEDALNCIPGGSSRTVEKVTLMKSFSYSPASGAVRGYAISVRSTEFIKKFYPPGSGPTTVTAYRRVVADPTPVIGGIAGFVANLVTLGMWPADIPSDPPATPVARMRHDYRASAVVHRQRGGATEIILIVKITDTRFEIADDMTAQHFVNSNTVSPRPAMAAVLESPLRELFGLSGDDNVEVVWSRETNRVVSTSEGYVFVNDAYVDSFANPHSLIYDTSRAGFQVVYKGSDEIPDPPTLGDLLVGGAGAAGWQSGTTRLVPVETGFRTPLITADATWTPRDAPAGVVYSSASRMSSWTSDTNFEKTVDYIAPGRGWNPEGFQSFRVDAESVVTPHPVHVTGGCTDLITDAVVSKRCGLDHVTVPAHGDGHLARIIAALTHMRDGGYDFDAMMYPEEGQVAFPVNAFVSTRSANRGATK